VPSPIEALIALGALHGRDEGDFLVTADRLDLGIGQFRKVSNGKSASSGMGATP